MRAAPCRQIPLPGCISTVFYYQTHEFTVITISVLIASAYFKPFLNVLLGFILAICCIVVHFYLFYSYTLPNDENNYAYPATILVDEVISAKQPQYIKATLLKLNGDEIHKFKAPKAMLSIDSAQLIKQGEPVRSPHVKKVCEAKLSGP